MKLLCKLAVGLFLAALLGGNAWAQPRIATIDLKKVLNRYWKTQEVKAILEDRRVTMEKELSKLGDDGKKLMKEYEESLADAGNTAMSSEQRDKSKKTAEEKLKAVRDLQDDIERLKRQDLTLLDEQNTRMFNNLMTDVRNTIGAKAKEGGFAMVIDSSAESAGKTPILLYTSGDAPDLSDKVSEDLERSRPAGGASDQKPAEKQPEKK
jgi:Skp family chaperone for outer membrane proteins